MAGPSVTLSCRPSCLFLFTRSRGYRLGLVVSLGLDEAGWIRFPSRRFSCPSGGGNREGCARVRLGDSKRGR